ncbi:MBL fold metallo-hydrolase [[Phormidium] sp. ETS-05]|uniref:MBL fold metallo-hydrolase n=1 Tax=[Phormidium] sp. ETS-05 TaxID=222819 RepID=UPI0018EF1B8D|nr:MBL fold metallo-hydrolase [[Phormidium] sp. ETS-05]
MNVTYLDSNSWLIEFAGQRILLDPWLVGPLVFGNAGWLFQGERRSPRSIPENIDLILLSQGLEDHAHPATLKALDRHIPVAASPNAAKVAQGLGYTRVTAVAHGGKFTVGNRLEIKALPGSPIGPTLIENAYILKDLDTGITLYYEPHGFHSPALNQEAPIDVAITPIVNLSIPILGPIIKGRETALELAKLVKPQIMLPTAAGGDVVFSGLLVSVLRAEGNLEDFRSLLARHGLSTQVIEPTPGEPVELSLTSRASAQIL